MESGLVPGGQTGPGECVGRGIQNSKELATNDDRNGNVFRKGHYGCDRKVIRSEGRSESRTTGGTCHAGRSGTSYGKGNSGRVGRPVVSMENRQPHRRNTGTEEFRPSNSGDEHHSELPLSQGRPILHGNDNCSGHTIGSRQKVCGYAETKDDKGTHSAGYGTSHSKGGSLTETSETRTYSTFNKERSTDCTAGREGSAIYNTSDSETQGPGDAVHLSPEGPGIGSPRNTGGNDGTIRRGNFFGKLTQSIFPMRIPGLICRYSDPLPEPIFLYRSGEVDIGLKFDEKLYRPAESYTVNLERLKYDTASLAKISTNRLDLKWILRQDEVYLSDLKVLMDMGTFQRQITDVVALHRGKKHVSRRMLRHLGDLKQYKVMSPGSPLVFHPTFTVPKKDDTLRLIMDCRRLNRSFAEPPAMDLPSIKVVISRILSSEWASQADAKSYFYQFPLHQDIQKYFGTRLGSARGAFEDVLMEVMPMGWSWAPALGQRVANVLVRECGIAWVDNFIILANDKEEFEQRRKTFLERTKLANLELDDEELAPEKEIKCLGIHFDLASKRYRMDEKWVEKVINLWGTELQTCKVTFRQFYALAGCILWRAHVMCEQLCLYPFLMQELGKIGRRVSQGESWENLLTVEDDLKQEVQTALTQLRKNHWKNPRRVGENKVDVWSDASDTHWAFVVVADGVVIEAKRGQTKKDQHIFYSELSAALGGLVAAHRKGYDETQCFVDNAPAAIALERGVSSNFTANKWLAAVTDINRKVTWVKSADQRADIYTRAKNGRMVPLPMIGSVFQ
eukprot:PhF_6_TR22574/c2_g3_i1/m.32151